MSSRADGELGGVTRLDPDLIQLIGRPERLTAVTLWRRLTGEERGEAVRCFLGHAETNPRDLLVAIAEARNFRLGTVKGWDKDKLISAAQTTRFDGATLVGDLLFHLHVGSRERMLERFMTAIGIPNKGGLVVEQGHIDDAKVDSQLVTRAGNDLANEFGLRDVVIYFMTLSLGGVPFDKGLWEWLTEVVVQSRNASGADPDTTDAQRDPDDVLQEDDPSRQLSFTTLDRLLVKEVVDTAGEIEGALNIDELDDAVEELLHLNGRRHRSYFHAGLRDVLFNRSLSKSLPAENRDRARWYWVGAVQGWARKEAWAEIVQAFDEHKTVRELGDGNDAAAMAAVDHIVRALSSEGRTTDLTHFLHPRVLAKSERLFRLVLDVGTGVLREGDAAEARRIFELLMGAVEKLEAEGLSRSRPMFLETRRRIAHCLRQLKEHRKARDILEDLLSLDPDPDVQAMVNADLGLLSAGFDRLVDVRLPPVKSELDLVTEALAKGTEDFNRSVAHNALKGAHGHYCLGVLCLGASEIERAGEHLEHARAGFRGQRTHYPKQLVAQADLYFGIARILSLSAEHLSHASDVIIEGLRGGAHFPAYFVQETVEALSLGEIDDLCAVSEAVLSGGGDEAIDALVESPAIEHCMPLASALRDRAMLPKRKSRDRSTDLRGALRGFLAASDLDTAGEILDDLETLAVKNVETREFLSLLEEPGAYDPAWAPEDAKVARAHCYEALGEYVPASQILQELFHQFLSGDGHSGLHDARGILERIKTYGLDEDHVEPLESRLQALASTIESVAAPVEEEARPVRVLVVGGAEAQERIAENVEEILGREYQHIRVTFIHTGWSGNWRKSLEDIRRSLPKNDALVIMRFIRTELGKQVRRNCPIPWRFCWGSGRRLLVRTVLEAAAAARR